MLTFSVKVWGEEKDPFCCRYKNGREIRAEEDERVKLRRVSPPDGTDTGVDRVHQLVLNDTHAGDSGDYTVSAVNECGESSHTVKVTVEDSGVPPRYVMCHPLSTSHVDINQCPLKI